MKKLTFTRKVIILFLMSIVCSKSFGQATSAGNSNIPVGLNEYVGWTFGVGLGLNIKNEDAYPINFHTFSGSGTILNLRMIIYDDPSNPFNAGFVGIGSPVPDFHLEVADDINLLPATFPNTGYRWQDSVILKTNNVLSNIFLGVNSGNNAGGGTSNTFLGAFSGEQHSGNSGGNTC